VLHGKDKPISSGIQKIENPVNCGQLNKANSIQV